MEHGSGTSGMHSVHRDLTEGSLNNSDSAMGFDSPVHVFTHPCVNSFVCSFIDKHLNVLDGWY